MREFFAVVTDEIGDWSIVRIVADSYTNARIRARYLYPELHDMCPTYLAADACLRHMVERAESVR